MVQQGSTRITPAETRKILSTLRSESETYLHAVAVGVVMHHKAQELAQELAVKMQDIEASAKTAASRVNNLQQAIDQADLAVRRAKADKIMLPSTASPGQIAVADKAIHDAERALQQAQGNLQASKTRAAQQQRQVADLQAILRSLSAVKQPDLTPIRILLDAVR
jgi:citrate lyase beta subunit